MSFEARSQGLLGSEIIDDTDAHTGNWFCFVVLATAVLTTSTAAQVTNEAGRSSLTLAEGTWHYGPFTSLTLASGVIQAFNTNSPD